MNLNQYLSAQNIKSILKKKIFQNYFHVLDHLVPAYRNQEIKTDLTIYFETRPIHEIFPGHSFHILGNVLSVDNFKYY